MARALRLTFRKTLILRQSRNLGHSSGCASCQHVFDISLDARFGILFALLDTVLGMSLLFVLLVSFSFKAFQDDVYLVFVLFLVCVRSSHRSLDCRMLPTQDLIFEVPDVLQDLGGNRRIPRSFRSRFDLFFFLLLDLFGLVMFHVHLVVYVSIITRRNDILMRRGSGNGGFG